MKRLLEEASTTTTTTTSSVMIGTDPLREWQWKLVAPLFPIIHDLCNPVDDLSMHIILLIVRLSCSRWISTQHKTTKRKKRTTQVPSSYVYDFSAGYNAFIDHLRERYALSPDYTPYLVQCRGRVDGAGWDARIEYLLKQCTLPYLVQHKDSLNDGTTSSLPLDIDVSTSKDILCCLTNGASILDFSFIDAPPPCIFPMNMDYLRVICAPQLQEIKRHMDRVGGTAT